MFGTLAAASGGSAPSRRPHHVKHLGILASVLVVFGTSVRAQDEEASHAAHEAAIQALRREGIVTGREHVIRLTPEEATAQAAFAPKPQYPFEARRQHIAGDGDFLIVVRITTGTVLRVYVEQSTGSRLLDTSAVTALKQWRFRPKVLRAVQRKYDPTDTSQAIVIQMQITFMLRPKV